MDEYRDIIICDESEFPIIPGSLKIYINGVFMGSESKRSYQCGSEQEINWGRNDEYF